MRIRVKVIALTAALAAATLLTVSVTAEARTRSMPTSPPELTAAGKFAAAACSGGCYNYVSGAQTVTGTGASVQMLQARPTLDPRDAGGHSLQELAVETSSRSLIVEVGWIVDPNLNGDRNPHLFVYHWVNNQPSCYNGCGFVRVSSPYKPGMAVTVNASGTYGIAFHGGNWWISYNGTEFGYFPSSLWGNKITKFQLVQAFGEVAVNGSKTCTDMGNGIFGSKSGSSWVSGFSLKGTSTAPGLGVFATAPSQYNQGQVTATGFHLGGPGGC
jgi:hypothetical protein